MRKHSLLALSCLSLLSFYHAPEARAAECQFPAPVESSAKQWLDAGFGMGVVMAKIMPDGQTCYLKLGVLDAESKQAVDENTVFEIGSISKVFTALAMLRLNEAKNLELSDTLQSLLPEVSIPTGSNRPITLLDLATQTSGLPRMPDNLHPADPNNPYADYSEGLLWAYLKNHQLKRPVGSQYEYSNLGFGLLGHALSRSAGQTYETLIREQILKPLNLKDTAITLARHQLMRFATGHNGTLPVSHWDLPTLAGAGALRSTAADLSQFIAAAMEARPTPLSKTFAASRAVQADTGNAGIKMGIGWHILTKGSEQVVFHDGGTGGFLSFAAFDPKTKEGIVVLANSSTFPVNEFGLHLMIPELPLPAPQKEVSITQADMDRLNGDYLISEIGLKVQVRREGDKLMAGFVGQGTVVLHPESPTRFYLTEAAVIIEFVLDDSGKATALKLTQSGQTFTGNKQ